MATLNEHYMGQSRYAAIGISNPYLVSALYAASKHNDKATRHALYTALLESTLILLTVAEFSEGLIPEHQTFEAGHALKLVAIENDTGASLLVAFTDEDAVLAWVPEGAPYLALKAPALFTLVLRNEMAGVIINPAGPVVGRVLQPEFSALAQGQLPFEVTSPPPPTNMERAPVLISQPTTLPPSDWLEILRVAMAQPAALTAAYLFQLRHGDRVAPWVVGICLAADTDIAQQQTTMETITTMCEQSLPENHGLTFVVLSEDMFLRTVQDTVKPLYARSVVTNRAHERLQRI